jgi:hypothetical protein
MLGRRVAVARGGTARTSGDGPRMAPFPDSQGALNPNLALSGGDLVRRLLEASAVVRTRGRVRPPMATLVAAEASRDVHSDSGARRHAAGNTGGALAPSAGHRR